MPRPHTAQIVCISQKQRISGQQARVIGGNLGDPRVVARAHESIVLAYRIDYLPQMLFHRAIERLTV
jgi:hypothetical protein